MFLLNNQSIASVSQGKSWKYFTGDERGFCAQGVQRIFSAKDPFLTDVIWRIEMRKKVIRLSLDSSASNARKTVRPVNRYDNSVQKIRGPLIHNFKGGLRAVSIFEAGKGILVLSLALFLSTFVSRDLPGIIAEIKTRWNVDPSSHIPHLAKMLMQDLTGARLHFLIMLAAIYALMRFIEAYGLWFARRWAEWFALVSGGVYLPIELYELAKGFSWLKMGILTINLIIVAYMALLLIRGKSVLKSNEGDA